MIEGQDGVTWEGWCALADACERSGLDGLFRSDHWTSGPDEPGSLDAWTTLAGLAARTQRIRLGTMVSPVTFRHPSLLAKAALTVDHISGGRVEIGLGAGWMEDEHRAYGFAFPPLSERLEQLAEQAEIVHRLLTEDERPLRGAALPARRGARAAAGGATSPAADHRRRRRAARNARSRPCASRTSTTRPMSTQAEAARRRARVREACERAGRDPGTMRFTLMTQCIVARDRDELRERARRVIERVGDDRDPDAYLAERRDRTLVGTVDEVARAAGRVRRGRRGRHLPPAPRVGRRRDGRAGRRRAGSGAARRVGPPAGRPGCRDGDPGRTHPPVRRRRRWASSAALRPCAASPRSPSARPASSPARRRPAAAADRGPARPRAARPRPRAARRSPGAGR